MEGLGLAKGNGRETLADQQSLSVVKKLLFSVVTFCLFALLLEFSGQVLFRIVLRKPFDNSLERALKYTEKYLRDGQYRISGANYTYFDGIPLRTLVPRSVDSSGRKVNALGFSEREVVIQPDHTTLFVVGDSMMQQELLSRRTTDFMRQLAEERGENIDVFNFAISGYNLLQEAALIRGVLVDLGPDIIYWVVFMHNDFEDLAPRDVRGMQIQRDLESYRGSTKVLMNTYLTGYIYPKIRSLLIDAFPELGSALPIVGLYSKHHPVDDYLKAQKQMFKANYKEYARTLAATITAARRRGVEVRPYLLPNMDGYTRDAWDREMILFAEELQVRYRIEVINLKPALLQRDLSDAFDKTEHFTKVGARMMAEILFSWQDNAAMEDGKLPAIFEGK